MCHDPKCKRAAKQAKVELKQTKILAQAQKRLANGRCEYHENLSKGQWINHGSMVVIVGLLWFIANSMGSIAGEAKIHTSEMAEVKTSQAVIQLTLNQHSSEDAHPEMMKLFRDHLERHGGVDNESNN